jgi:hypothetical protein
MDEGMTALVKLKVAQGQTWRHTFLLTRPDPASTTEHPLPPIPLETVGCTGAMQCRAKYGAPVLLELTTANGGIVVDPTVDGRVTIVMTAAQTDALGATEDPAKPRRSFHYDLELTYPSGDVVRVLQSPEGDPSTISPNITRSTGVSA